MITLKISDAAYRIRSNTVANDIVSFYNDHPTEVYCQAEIIKHFDMTRAVIRRNLDKLITMKSIDMTNIGSVPYYGSTKAVNMLRKVLGVKDGD